jgi:hypothetical protein
MEQAEIDRVRRALRRRPKPPWRVLWRGRPYQLRASGRSVGPWSRRRLQLQAGWQLLWAERLRRDLALSYRFVACRRGRHRDAQVMGDVRGLRPFLHALRNLNWTQGCWMLRSRTRQREKACEQRWVVLRGTWP